MKYCVNCGAGHECEADDTARHAEVEIERLRTDRDIQVARITAKAGVAISETEAEHETAHAEGLVEGVETVLDAVTGEGPAEAEAVAEGEPIVVEAGPEPELEPVLAAEPPPEAVTTGTGNGKGGWWGAYH